MSNIGKVKLPPDCSQILLIKQLPFTITNEELYDIFGRFGVVRQIRVGNTNDTRGTAFVVYDNIYDAKNAVDNLSGFNVCGRYLVVLYYTPHKVTKRMDIERRQAEINAAMEKHGMSSLE